MVSTGRSKSIYPWLYLSPSRRLVRCHSSLVSQSASLATVVQPSPCRRSTKRKVSSSMRLLRRCPDTNTAVTRVPATATPGGCCRQSPKCCPECWEMSSLSRGHWALTRRRVVHHHARHEGELVIEQVGGRGSSLQLVPLDHCLHQLTSQLSRVTCPQLTWARWVNCWM